MFASILRRWRLATPLALVTVALMVVSMSTLMPASAKAAHKLHFAFAGDTAAFVDLGVQPQFIECFSGAVESDSHDLNRTGFIGEDDACPTPLLDSVDGIFVAVAGAAVARIRSDHTRVEGHTISQSEVIGAVAIFGFEEADLLHAAGILPFGIDIDSPVPIACAGRTCRLVTSADNVFNKDCTLKVVKTTQVCRFVGPDVEAGDFARSQAEAECQKKHGRVAGEASVLGLSQFDDLDMEAVSGGVDFIRELKPTAFTFTGNSVQFVAAGQDATEILIVNESTRQISDDFGAISVNALHFLEQNGAGFIQENILVAHSFAQIHCHSGRFSFEDGIGA